MVIKLAEHGVLHERHLERLKVNSLTFVQCVRVVATHKKADDRGQSRYHNNFNKWPLPYSATLSINGDSDIESNEEGTKDALNFNFLSDNRIPRYGKRPTPIAPSTSHGAYKT